jgi:hypothetical protein
VALSKAEEQAAADRAEQVRHVVGHPEERWDALKDKVQAQSIREFAHVTDDFLALLWCLDAYRKAQAPPEHMGKAGTSWAKRLEGAYRGKGNWFATLLSLLLNNRTGEKIRSRGQIDGFSQNHQIDLAWPDRKIQPVICAESKLTGAPGHGDTPPRGAMDDWSNRRKELKFAATDLKLSRREQTESIVHWDTWRKNALPKCFMFWGARLAPGDELTRMIREATVVVATYLDGAGIVAWRETKAGDGYALVPLPKGPEVRVVSLDDVLWQMEDEIKRAKQSGLDKPTEPAAPIDLNLLTPDSAK